MGILIENATVIPLVRSMFAGQTVDLTTGMHCTPCALVTENKTPAANLHRKTRLLAKCRTEHILHWKHRSGGKVDLAELEASARNIECRCDVSEIRGCQKDNCAPEQPRGWGGKKRVEITWETPRVDGLRLT